MDLGSAIFSIVVIDDAADIGVRFAIGWNTAVLLHAAWASVVRSQRLWGITVILLQQLAQIFGAAIDVGFGIVGILHAEFCRRLRHQLHKTLGAFGRPGTRV